MQREMDPVDSEILAEARARADAGASAAYVLALLHAQGVSPIGAIRVIRDVFGLSLRDAKITLDTHEAWRLEVAASDRLRLQALEAVTGPLLGTIPGAYRELVTWLRSVGFVVSEWAESSAFGDRLFILSRPPLQVRLASDRGEWSLELREHGWGGHDWFEPDVWIAHLDGVDTQTDGLPVDEEARVVRDRLPAITELVRRPREEVLPSLRGLQERRAFRALGLDERPPPEERDVAR